MEKKLNAYQFWYKSEEDARTEYIYIIAESEKMAIGLFASYGYNKFYDYDITPIDVIEGQYFLYDHKAGDVLGQFALI